MLVARLDTHLAQSDKDYGLLGVRANNGVLRYRVWSTSVVESFGPLIWAAIQEAAMTCEVCGKPGERLGDGDVAVVLCPAPSRPHTLEAWNAGVLADAPLARSRFTSLVKLSEEETLRQLSDMFTATMMGVHGPPSREAVDARRRSALIVGRQHSLPASHLDRVLSDGLLRSALSTYALNCLRDLHLEEAREVREEHGTASSPPPKDLLRLLIHTEGQVAS